MSPPMPSPTDEAIAAILTQSFHVDSTTISPESTLESLGLDSLALMEFVFAVEDRFSVRIPEDRLDPRQAGITLARLAALIDDAVAGKGGDVAAA
jgi:acyl carrier protein